MNRSSELVRSILSCEERISIDHEYVIIDNGSTDTTEADITDLTKNVANIYYYKQKKNLGVAGGRNLGYKLASGEICYFIDDDAVVSTKGKILDSAYEYIHSNSELFAMSTNCFDHKKNEYVVGGFQKKSREDKPCYVKGFTGFSHFIAKNRFPKEYLYPDNLVYGSEELYFALCSFKYDGKIWYYQDMLVEHFPSVSTRNSPEWQKKNAYINTYVIKKYTYPVVVIWVSSIFFGLRAMRNEKYNISKLMDYYREAKKRYNKKYIDRLTLKQYFELLKKYRVMSIL